MITFTKLALIQLLIKTLHCNNRQQNSPACIDAYKAGEQKVMQRSILKLVLAFIAKAYIRKVYKVDYHKGYLVPTDDEIPMGHKHFKVSTLEQFPTLHTELLTCRSRFR